MIPFSYLETDCLVTPILLAKSSIDIARASRASVILDGMIALVMRLPPQHREQGTPFLIQLFSFQKLLWFLLHQ